MDKNDDVKNQADQNADAGSDKGSKAYERWKDKDKNNMGNDVTSEIKIANAGGELEGGENKQWHMDQGNFDDSEKKDFEPDSQEKK